MTRTLDVSLRPQAEAPRPLIAVDRAIAELRRGQIVIIVDQGRAVALLAAEAVAEESLARLAALSATPPVVLLTARRLAALGLAGLESGVARLFSPSNFDAETISILANPCAEIEPGTPPADFTVETGGIQEESCIALAKLARLLPAAVIVPLSESVPDNAVIVESEDILQHQIAVARSLSPVAEARVPLDQAENVRIIAFRPSDGGIEHLAIVIGDPDPDQAVLCRLHSECFTGDLLGSLRCDCGDQLRGAIGEIAAAGSGVLLYLAQEGRGIGLVNKLRAYQLQDAGFDTLDANLQLGFDDDERIYLPAAQMLDRLGIHRVRLMTNNPAKVAALARHGIDVAERVPHIFPSNDHNQGYLLTKATRSGHLF
ncbi:GTP cyclohydrolase II [Magnetospirillum molischianum]|uniref:GTP cyclohydrolase-2 n=1 Tax=Magnetospirillum molischianum DSM 120 TaxID=1150626 RepID=H8FTD8_MAGML|nr:GTP cyclohydrolase II [Magnetospirillum molischianum]CCG41626.1 GTP cyclohydrolase-2 [Magnetospirillum molischianum DSM 120]